MNKMAYRYPNGRYVDLLFRRRRREDVEAFYVRLGMPLYGFDRNLFDAC